MNSTSRMISRLARHTPFQSTCSVRPVRHLSTRTMAAAHQAPSTIEVFVKGDGPNQVNGDCPFCQRVLITLQAKGLPYSLTFIDFENKPAWLQELSGGKVPAIKYTPSEAAVSDSDIIVQQLETRFPTPAFVASAPAEIGAKLFPSFRAFLMASRDPSLKAECDVKEAALMSELNAINTYLTQHGTPFFGGSVLDATDAAICPKLYHVSVALPLLRGWSIPSELSAVTLYLESLVKTSEWQLTGFEQKCISDHYTPLLIQ